jgi:HPt (histidine-containing phosphotransfer) domain-containing protein
MTFIVSRSRADSAMSGSVPFDQAGTLQRLGNDRALYADLVKFFLEDSKDLFNQLQTQMNAEDADGVGRASHALRGICANFGASEAVDLCWTIERRVGVGDWREVRTAAGQLDAGLKRLRLALEKSIA